MNHAMAPNDITFSEPVILGAAGMSKMTALANFDEKSLLLEASCLWVHFVQPMGKIMVTIIL